MALNVELNCFPRCVQSTDVVFVITNVSEGIVIKLLPSHLVTILVFFIQNLPFSVDNKWRLLGMMVVFFGSGFAFPFIVVRHQILKK